MTSEPVKCPLCRRSGIDLEPSLGPSVKRTTHAPCGPITFDLGDAAMFAGDAIRSSPERRNRIISLLVERRLKNPDGPNILLVLGPHEGPQIPGFATVRVDELIDAWPANFSEWVDRAFFNLMRHPKNEIGKPFKIATEGTDLYSFFTTDPLEQRFFVDLFSRKNWLRVLGQEIGKIPVVIDHEGWAKYEELDRLGSRVNPAFVAMWFGEPDRTKQMKELYDRAIEPACRDDAHWAVKKADSIPHNDQIMGQVLQDIRVAPFVIADLTENNPGVYYEAGFAQSLKKSVIYCCPKGQWTHFDVSGISQIRYTGPDDLRSQLKNNILFTQGEGPPRPK